LQALGNTFVGLSALLLVAEAHAGRMSAGTAGMSLSYSLVFTDYLNWLVRVFTTLETQMVSVERVRARGGARGARASADARRVRARGVCGRGI
jgi:ABC-type multidrug transport system fused ATPase/permease subunit